LLLRAAQRPAGGGAGGQTIKRKRKIKQQEKRNGKQIHSRKNE
jgi:hypothetical protein